MGLCGSLVSTAKAKLREWVEANGSVELPGTGKELRLNPVSGREADARTVLNVIGMALIVGSWIAYCYF